MIYAQQTETLYICPTTSKEVDAYIQVNQGNPVVQDANFSQSGVLLVDAWTHLGDLKKSRTLMRWDFSSIPKGSTILSAKLELFHATTVSTGNSTEAGSNKVWVERIIEDWDGNTVSWSTQPATTPIDRKRIKSDSVIGQRYLQSNAKVFIKELIQYFIDHPEENYGLMLRLETEEYYRRKAYFSSDYSDSTKHPRLVVTYCCGTATSPSSSTGKDQVFWSKSGSEVNGGAYLGTKNEKPLVLKANENEGIRIKKNGSVVLKENTTLKKHAFVNGNILLEGILKLKKYKDTTNLGMGLRYLMVNKYGNVVEGTPRLDVQAYINGGGVMPHNFDLNNLQCIAGGNTANPFWLRDQPSPLPNGVEFAGNIYLCNTYTLGLGRVSDFKANGERYRLLVDGDTKMTGSLKVEDHVELGGNAYVGNKMEVGGLSPTSGTVHDDYALSVHGKIVMKEGVVTVDNWSDFVFNEDYALLSLKELEKYIGVHGHLPDVPSEKEVKEVGVNIGEMNALLLQKVEELTLHIIEQEKRIQRLEKK